jgi:hypothetical protein
VGKAGFADVMGAGRAAAALAIPRAANGSDESPAGFSHAINNAANGTNTKDRRMVVKS